MSATSDIPLAARERSTERDATWKLRIAAVAAVLLGIVYLVSGAWKVFQPFQSGELLEQAQVPAGLGVLGASTLGTLELFAAALLFVPRFRRWGGLFGSALMLFFIGWIGYYYHVLVGHECSCFPIVKRTVGPGFFIGDGVFLLFGILAFLWSPLVTKARGAAVLFVSLVVLSGASFAVNAAIRRNVQVPNPVVVNGRPVDLTHGKVFLYFYNPECMHCIDAAKFMSKLNWGNTELVGIPTNDPQFAKDFLGDTHLKADTSLELGKLKKAFPFVDPPFGVALDNGRVKESFGQAQFTEPLPAPDLKKFGFVQ